MRPSISVFNALGSPLCTIPWDQALIAGLGWTQDEDLLVISKTGEVALPSMHRFVSSCLRISSEGMSMGQQDLLDFVQRDYPVLPDQMQGISAWQSSCQKPFVVGGKFCCMDMQALPHT